ncbi:hypothetical protein GCM10010172_39220 [Paractinoplanes ferrugineus]|uniref:Uncharacterized protein n=1 Tax=Paractinoplanes ferrugineus TaxID=113564 RepID=A0A919J2G4_9ACTN|nr:hypothetical protein [Actinoplanes ferrugineus]GIE12698.1 hypothetical protein Afe05nite_45380 [Actinoplanes ferrugineus]
MLRDVAARRPAAQVEGSFDPAGMDATWVLRVRGARVDAEVFLLRGPVADLAGYQLDRIDEGVVHGGGQNFPDEQPAEWLDGLARREDERARPEWLRPADVPWVEKGECGLWCDGLRGCRLGRPAGSTRTRNWRCPRCGRPGSRPRW